MLSPSIPLYPNAFNTIYYAKNTPRSKEWYAQNWTEYLSETTVAKYTGDVVGSYIKEASEQQIEAIHESSRMVAEANLTGLMAVSSFIIAQTRNDKEHFLKTTQQLNSLLAAQKELLESQIQTREVVVSGINQIDWRLNSISEQINVSNLLLGDLSKLLRIPDSQKERQFKIDMALKFFKQLQIDKDFVNDAIENFREAEKLLPSDSFVLYHLGIIYLYEIPVIDLEKAENYFINAAKYSLINQDFTSATLTGDERVNYYGSIEFTGNCYYQAAIASFVQCNFSKGIEYINKALKYIPNDSNYLYLKIRLLTGNESIEDAIHLSNELINIDSSYLISIVNDINLIRHKEFTDLILSNTSSVKQYVLKTIDSIKSTIVSGSAFKKELLTLNALDEKSTFTSFMECKTVLNMEMELKKESPLFMHKKGNLETLIKFEKEYYDELFILTKLKINNIKQLNELTYTQAISESEKLLEKNNLESLIDAFNLLPIKGKISSKSTLDNPSLKIVDLIYQNSGNIIEVKDALYLHYIPDNNLLVVVGNKNITIIDVETESILITFKHSSLA